MSTYIDGIAFRTIAIEIPAADLLSCIWHSDGSGATGGGVGIDLPSDAFRIAHIQELGDRPDIVRITLTSVEHDPEFGDILRGDE